jgi:hypothetical protein
MAEPYSLTAAYEPALAEAVATELHARVIQAEDAILTRSLESSRDDASREIRAQLTALRSAADALLRVKIREDGLEVQLTVCNSVSGLLSCGADFTVRRVVCQ